MPADIGDAVRCAGLQVSYSGAPAIDRVDLAVAPGEMVAVLGASGSGKSTLLHAIAGLVQPSAGEIWLSGQRVATAQRSTAPELRAVGLVFQDFALWPHLTVVDTVAYPVQRAGRGRTEARAVARTLLDELDIGHLAHRRPAQLSGGQQQRVGLARALAREPRVFLLDEPTAHLDTHLRAAFQDSVRERQAATGAAAVYATHDAGEALALADRVALMVAGQVVQIGSPREVYEQPVSAATAGLTGPYSVLAASVSVPSAGVLAIDLGDGYVEVPGFGVTGAQGVLLRPDWVRIGGPFRARIATCAFRGAHTDYALVASAGAVHMQLPGPPQYAVGESVEWGVRRAWALPGGPDVQPSAVIAPG